MIGISVFRFNTNISQQALDFESCGQWNRALNCYEQILQCNPNNIEYHKKYLKCLLSLGHFAAVISHVNGVQHIDISTSSKQKQQQQQQQQKQYVPTTLTNMTTQSLSTLIADIPQNNNMNNMNNNNNNKDIYIYKNDDINNNNNNNNNNNKNISSFDELISFGIESCWKLGQWELLNKFVDKCPKQKLETEFQCKLGECLSILSENSRFTNNDLTIKFENKLNCVRLIVMKQISRCYMEGYNATYQYLVQLHMIQEIQHYKDSFFNDTINNDNNNNKLYISLFNNNNNENKILSSSSEQQQSKYMNVNNSFYWKERLNRTANKLSIREPILSLRRILYYLLSLKEEESYCWLQLAKISRSHQQLQIANTSLIYAEKIGSKLNVPYIKWYSFLEKLQLIYNQGEINKSLMKAQKILNDKINKIPISILSKINVLCADLMNKTKSFQDTIIMQKYKTAINQLPNNEQPYFKFATYLDELITNNRYQAKQDKFYKKSISSKEQYRKYTKIKNVERLEIEGIPIKIAAKYNLHNLYPLIISNYCLSLIYGYKHLFRSLPRCIHLWFSVGKCLNKLTKLKYNNNNNNNNMLSSSSSSSLSSSSSSSSSSTQQSDNNIINSINWISGGTIMQFPSYFDEWTKDLPEYQYMCILPIITSRILNDQIHISQFIETVLKRCITKYPPQLLWHIALLINYKHLDSNKSQKRLRCAKKITIYLKNHIQQLQFNHNNNNNNYNNNNNNNYDKIIKLFEEMTKILSLLIQFVPPINSSKHNNKKEIKCPKYLCDKTINDEPFQVIVPTQINLEPSLPSLLDDNNNLSGTNNNNINNNKNLICFNENIIKIHRFCEKFKTMHSAAKPKRIKLIGTDGIQYSFLMKRECRGDMRKDSRLMEVCGVINRLFNNNINTRNRNLNLRNYSVICLTEQVGMIEWVENVETLRSILNKTYDFNQLIVDDNNDNMGGIAISLKDITTQLRHDLVNLQRKFVETKEINYKKLTDLFNRNILSKSPLLLHKYFELNWNYSCNDWYSARLLYSRSSSIWCIVGFIIALGDRHLENILINIKTGECVHVDFDCLFDKAKTFKVPEQVSFRLTKNIIDGFGICGIEGNFRKCAQFSLQLLKNQSQTLIQSLHSFIYDPLIENIHHHNNNNNHHENQMMNDQIKNIKSRLNGNIPSLNFNQNNPKLSPQIDFKLQFSTNGQVQHLIQQCSNKSLLSKMFAGWMPFC